MNVELHAVLSCETVRSWWHKYKHVPEGLEAMPVNEQMNKTKSSPGNHKTSPRSRTSLELGSVMLRSKAVRGGIRVCVSPARHLRAVDAAGPLARTTATPHLPWPEDRAKMVSASASVTGSPRQRNLQGGATPLVKYKKKKKSLIAKRTKTSRN